MRVVTILEKGAARRVVGQSSRRTRPSGLLCWRPTLSIWHPRAPCRNEHRVTRALLLRLCIAPSLTRPSPLTVSPRPKTVLPSFRATQSCWPPHSQLCTAPNAPAPSPCFCTSPLALCFSLHLRAVFLASCLAVASTHSIWPASNWLPTHASATAFTTATDSDRLLAVTDLGPGFA